MHSSTIITILTAIAALASTLSAPLLDQVWPGHGAYLMAVLTVASLVAGVVITAISKQTHGAPATSVVADAPIVVPNGTAAGEPTGATVVSTSSSLLPSNQPH